jgi:hypothetical protein
MKALIFESITIAIEKPMMFDWGFDRSPSLFLLGKWAIALWWD